MVTGAEITIGKQVIEQFGKLPNKVMNSRKAKSIVSKVIQEVCKGADADLLQVNVWLKELESLGASGKDYETAKLLAKKVKVAVRPAIKRPAAKKPAVKKAAAKKPAVKKPAVRKPAVKKTAI